jgi:hypothetical protein
MTKDEIKEPARRRALEIETRFPAFTFCRRAYLGFLESLNVVSCREFGEPDYIAMRQLDRLFASLQGKSARWGQLFIDIWYCTNWSEQWEGIVREDRQSAVNAVEHCYWVLAVSGADSSMALAILLNQTDTWQVVEPKLREIAAGNDWSGRWIESLVGQATRKQ